jgi:hypothetical protein
VPKRDPARRSVWQDPLRVVQRASPDQVSDVSKLLAYGAQEELAIENAKRVQKALLESTGAKTTSGPHVPARRPPTPAGCAARPVIGRSVTSAIPGTPHVHRLEE